MIIITHGNVQEEMNRGNIVINKKIENCPIARYKLSRVHNFIKLRCYIFDSGYKRKNIKMCQDWIIFENFYQWAINNGYKDKLSIDRIDSSSNYCPNNCRFIPIKENVSRSKYKNLTPFDNML